MRRGNKRQNSKITEMQNLETPERSSRVHFVEVDLKYPEHFHDLLMEIHLPLRTSLENPHGFYPLHSLLALSATKLPT